MNFFLLFYRRNWKTYSFVFVYTLMILLLVSVSTIGGAIFERIAINQILDESEQDFEISCDLRWVYDSNNISELLTQKDNWEEVKQEWKNIILNDFYIILIDFHTNNTDLKIGIALSDIPISLKDQDFLQQSVNFYSRNFTLESFEVRKDMPFSLDILFSTDLFEESIPSEFQIYSNNSKLGYSVDFNKKQIKTFNSYSKKLDLITERFRVYLIQQKLRLSEIIKENTYDISTILNYKQPFDSIVFLITVLVIISSTWIIELIAESYIKKVYNSINQIIKYGLDEKSKEKITLSLPVITDGIALLIASSLLLLLNFLFNLNLTFAYLAMVIIFLFIAYKRYRKATTQAKNKLNTSQSIVIYSVIVICAILIQILIKQLLGDLLPSNISSFITISTEIIQYFIIALFFTEIFIRLLSRCFLNKATLGSLVFKIIDSKKCWLQQWLHSTVLFIWSVTIITSSIQSFNYNYENNIQMENPTDIVVKTDILLFNISEMVSSSDFTIVHPITHSTEIYFQDYDLYLMNFSVIRILVPNYQELMGLDELKEGYTYISKSFAKILNLDDGDYFSTKFGENKSSTIYVNQQLITTEYFPLVKPLNDRPFVISSYKNSFSNYTRVNKLGISFRENISTENGLNILREFIGDNFYIEDEIYVINFDLTLQFYQYIFPVFSAIFGVLSFIRLVNQFLPSIYSLHQRGLSKNKIRKILLTNLLPFLLFTQIFGFLFGLFYMFVQFPSTIYQISLFTKIQISFGFDTFLIFLIPILCVLYLLKVKICTSSNFLEKA